MIETRRDGHMAYFDFVCPGCEAEGELGIDTREGMKPFGCPEECGSMFVPWQPDGTTWQLKCVVQRCAEGTDADEDPGSDDGDPWGEDGRV